MAIYDVNGGEITSVDNAAKLKLYPWPVIFNAADLTASAASAGTLQDDVFTLAGSAGACYIPVTFTVEPVYDDPHRILHFAVRRPAARQLERYRQSQRR